MRDYIYVSSTTGFTFHRTKFSLSKDAKAHYLTLCIKKMLYLIRIFIRIHLKITNKIKFITEAHK